MVEQGEDTEKTISQSKLSVQASTDLLELLLQRGYLHDEENVQPSIEDPERGNPQKDDDFADTTPPVFSSDDPDCQVVFLSNSKSHQDPCCCTYPALEQSLNKALKASGGRASLSKMIPLLKLQDENPILRIIQHAKDKYLFLVGNDVLSSHYLDEKSKQVFESLLNTVETGFALVSDLSTHDFHLPMDVTLEALEKRLSQDIQMISLEAGTALASDKYLHHFKEKVLETFQKLEEPALISDICHDQHWDNALVASWVQELCQDEKLSGDFHGGSDANSIVLGAMYTPHAHVAKQRQEVDNLFSTQGYLTATRGVALGLSKSKMGEYLLESFPSAVVISESLVVNPDVITNPLEAVLQEAVASEHFVDLQDHLPIDILEQEQDARIILVEYVLPMLEKGDESKKNKKKKKWATDFNFTVGVPVVTEHGSAFVSSGMLRSIQELLHDLIGNFAKQRAEQIDADAVANEHLAQYSKSTSSSSKKKGGRKGKKSSKQKSAENETDEVQQSGSSDVVPLSQVIKRIIEVYPELAEVDRVAKDLLVDDLDDGGSHLSWDNSQNDGDGEESLLCELCRNVFYTEEFVKKCESAIEIEVRQLQSARLSKANLTRKDAATKIRNVEAAFEESFNTACYMLQCQKKFLEYVENAESILDDDTTSKSMLLDALTKELLQGCCADFTSRLTQYCLFKNEVDGDSFSFLANGADEGEEEDGLPRYCSTTDLAIRQYPQIYLSCDECSAGESKAKGPLPKLREELSGSLGVSLARQWTACGGECYEGGTKVDDDGTNITRPGDLEKFFSLVEENCLTLCGYPFKKLDKKSEKQFLFSRRQRLLQLLEESADAGNVLDFTIMLLFQQVKNVVVSGRHVRTDILKLLVAERKIGEDVASALTELAKAIPEEAGEVSSTLVDTVKACGLCRDISKHKTENDVA